MGYLSPYLFPTSLLCKQVGEELCTATGGLLAKGSPGMWQGIRVCGTITPS